MLDVDKEAMSGQVTPKYTKSYFIDLMHLMNLTSLIKQQLKVQFLRNPKSSHCMTLVSLLSDSTFL